MDVSRNAWSNQNAIFMQIPGKVSFAQGKNTLQVNKSRNTNATAQNAAAATQTQTEPDIAVQVDISPESQKLSFELKELGANPELKLEGELFSKEVRDQRKADFANSLGKPVTIDPFDNEFQILAVTSTYNEGTLEKFLTDNLEGKAKNASLVAGELAKMIRGSIHNPDATVEERAINRETALRNTESIAQTYFDNPEEAKAFLDEINRFAENDILREKGYVVLDNSDMVPFKSYQSSVRSGGVSWDAYAKEYGYSSAKEIFNDPKKVEEFYSAIQKNGDKWNEKLTKDFKENEQKVVEIISNIKNSLNETDVNNSLQRLLKAF